MLKNLVFLLAYLGTGAWLQAQDSVSGPSLSASSAENAVAVYTQALDHQSRLYNGVEHYGYNYRIKGFAYLQDPAVQKGRVVYDELVYTDVPMWYDLLKDQVIIQHFNTFTRLGLVPDKVKEFTIFNRHFIRVQIDSLSGAPLRTGFYEQLYNGRSQVLAKRVKIINETVKDEVERDFVEFNYYYIKKDNRYHSVKNSGGLLSVFKERAKEVKQYLRKNKIRYKKNPEDAIVKATAYYDSLNQ